MDRTAVIALQNQFDSTIKMLKDLINVIPDDIWITEYHGTPIWKQIFHVVYFIDYWIRTSVLSH